MAHAERDALKVDVPVGFLLNEYREVVVRVDRPAAEPLAIRLRLIPAAAADRPDFGGSPPRSRHDTPAPFRRFRLPIPEHELGGSD